MVGLRVHECRRLPEVWRRHMSYYQQPDADITHGYKGIKVACIWRGHVLLIIISNMLYNITQSVFWRRVDQCRFIVLIVHYISFMNLMIKVLDPFQTLKNQLAESKHFIKKMCCCFLLSDYALQRDVLYFNEPLHWFTSDQWSL